jgi:Holliday junction resolvasome RuvABC endonuclease subunit
MAKMTKRSKKEPPPYSIYSKAPLDNNGVLLSIDPGTISVGWAIYDLGLENEPLAANGAWALKGDPYARMFQLIDILRNWGYMHRVRALCIERQFVGKGMQASLMIGRGRGWGEAIVGTIQPELALVMDITPLAWKWEYMGDKYASPESVLRMIESEYSLDHVTNGKEDAAAATAIGKVCLNRIKRYQMGLETLALLGG